MLLRIIKNLADDIIRVENAVGIRGRGSCSGIFLQRLELVEGGRIAVVVIDMTAHDMQDDKIIF